MPPTKPTPSKPSLFESLKALKKRKTLAMFVLGFAAGLPYVLITGTLLAWFTKEGVEVKTIGVFSWVILIYAFKFLWSPAIDRLATPHFFNMGQRRAGILIFQSLIIALLAFISFASPQTQLGWIAIAAVLCTICSSSQDVLIDAWRIEVADEEVTIDILSSVYQIGYRLAATLGAAGALIIAARMGWNNTFLLLALLMALAVSGVFIAQDSPISRNISAVDKDAPFANQRNIILLIVLAGWAWSFTTLFGFMSQALNNPETANARNFTREMGPLIVFISVIAPVIAAALILKYSKNLPLANSSNEKWPAQNVLDVMYNAVLAPMIDFIRRLGFGAVLVLLLALSYRFVDLIWGAFAYPFYLGENYGALGHSLDEVAIASKLFGTFMTFFGITIGGVSIIRFGRMPCLLFGAIIAAATNLLLADLALGGSAMHSFMSTFHLYAVFQVLQPLANFLTLDVTVNEKLSRLMMVIAAENLAVGFASAAIVVYLSSVVNPRYAAVQYALLASLSMLIGSFGRAALGELIETEGFAYVFYLTAAMGLVAVIVSILEWIRQARVGAPDVKVTSTEKTT